MKKINWEICLFSGGQRGDKYYPYIVPNTAFYTFLLKTTSYIAIGCFKKPHTS